LPAYPHACRAYNCKLLKDVIAERETLQHALTVVEQTRELIREVAGLLPPSPKVSFRERLEDEMEGAHKDPQFQQKASALLKAYEQVFGVDDVVDMGE